MLKRSMQRIITYSLKDDFIKRLADFIETNYINQDLTRLALVFGGKRPALFLKRELAARLKRSFLPPRFFSIDEFVEYIVSKDLPLLKITDLDACYIIYNLAKEISEDILKDRKRFCQFLPWAREILAFIEQLDLEDIKLESLQNIQVKADIGYDIPESVNTLLKNIISIRERFHCVLKERTLYYRGLIYLMASQLVEQMSLQDFTDILFCGFFYLHKTEEKIIKHIYLKQKAKIFFQGDQDDWPVLKDLFEVFSCDIKPYTSEQPTYNLKIFSGFDVQSEACLVNNALRELENLDDTIVVLPNPENL
ncbi:MAG: hypothetical protein NC908_03830, partial [Candidatus Omnitrophica bacterium]|nr:hypothetical protein [Candidatus Omnitrophota bacterium]